jgi:hypothetical protein
MFIFFRFALRPSLSALSSPPSALRLFKFVVGIDGRTLSVVEVPKCGLLARVAIWFFLHLRKRLSMKKIKPVEKDKDGNIVFNLDADEANADWIRAGRLLKKAQAGDKEAAAKLKKMEETPMRSYTFDELNEISGGMLDDWP